MQAAALYFCYCLVIIFFAATVDEGGSLSNNWLQHFFEIMLKYNFGVSCFVAVDIDFVV